MIQDLNYLKVEVEEAIKCEYLDVAISTYRISLSSDFGFVEILIFTTNKFSEYHRNKLSRSASFDLNARK